MYLLLKCQRVSTKYFEKQMSISDYHCCENDSPTSQHRTWVPNEGKKDLPEKCAWCQSPAEYRLISTG